MFCLAVFLGIWRLSGYNAVIQVYICFEAHEKYFLKNETRQSIQCERTSAAVIED